VILDKTGTITEGRPAVTDLIWYYGDRDTNLPILMTLEA